MLKALLLTASLVVSGASYAESPDLSLNEYKAAIAGIPTMSVEDYLLDKKSLTGKAVTVYGAGGCMSPEFCSIMAPEQLMTSFLFDPANSARDIRKTLLECNYWTCDVTITFTVSENFSQRIAHIRIEPSDRGEIMRENIKRLIAR